MNLPSSEIKPESEPGVASAEGGFVFLDGPDGVAATMTADAAHRTGRSLIDAAVIARTQTVATDV